MSIFSNIKDSVLDTTETFKEVMGGALKGACNVIMESKSKSKEELETFQSSSDSSEYLYSLNISKLLGSEYILYVEDVMRMVTIQIIIQLMMYLQAPSSNKFFDTAFIQIVLYVVLGVTAYWLLVRKCVKVV